MFTIPDDCTAVYKKVSKIILLYFTGTVFSSFVNVGINFSLLEKSKVQSSSIWAILFVFGLYLVACTFAMLPFVSVFYRFVQYQSFSTMQVAMDKCLNLIPVGGQRSINDMRLFLDCCIHMSKVLEAFEEAFGGLLYIEIAVNAILETVGVFFGCLMFTSYKNGSFNSTVFLVGLYFGTIGIISLARLAFLVNNGQYLTNKVAKIKRFLREVKMEMELDNKDQLKLDHILDTWNRPAAIRPMDTFDLSNSTMLSFSGVLTTYVVILLQFKFGE